MGSACIPSALPTAIRALLFLHQTQEFVDVLGDGGKTAFPECAVGQVNAGDGGGILGAHDRRGVQQRLVFRHEGCALLAVLGV